MKKCYQSYTLSDNLGHKGRGISFYRHFAPPHPCAMLTKHLDLMQVCIWLCSNIERGNGGAGTYSIGIMVMSSCFCYFPTQFVHSCSIFDRISCEKHHIATRFLSHYTTERDTKGHYRFHHAWVKGHVFRKK